MNLGAVAASALVVLGLASTAAAGPVAEAAMRAEALQADGRTVQAVDALEEAEQALWEAVPLGFREPRLVNSASGFRSYELRGDTAYAPGETLTVYVEPVGHASVGSSGGTSSVGFTGDLSLRNATGQVLTELRDAFSLSADLSDPRRFGATISFAVPELGPGDYVARVTLRDSHSDKSGTFEVPFSVAAAAAPTAEAPEAEEPQAASGKPAASGAGQPQ